MQHKVRRSQRLLSLLLALAMLVGFFPVMGTTASAAVTEGWSEIGSCEWKIEDGTLTIRPMGNGTSGMLPGLSAPSKWISYKSNLTKIVIEPGVKAGDSLLAMFGGLEKVTEIIGLSNLDTSDTSNMSGMFSGCASLTFLDLSGFDTRNVTNMYGMFSKCSALTTILVGSNWDASKVEIGGDVFSESYDLLGGGGTTYDSAKVDSAYAHVDDGENNKGYLTSFAQLNCTIALSDGKAYTYENKAIGHDITAAAANAGLSYDSENSQWIMSNFSFVTTAATALRVMGTGQVKIRVDGTNSIQSGTTDSAQGSYGISAVADVLFSGDGTLNVTAGGATGTDGCSYGISGSNYDLTFAGPTVNVISGAADKSSALSSILGTVTVSAGSVTATAGTGTASYGVYADSEPDAVAVSTGTTTGLAYDSTDKTYKNGDDIASSVTLTPKQYVAVIGETKFESVQEAVNAATTGTEESPVEIDMIADSTENVTIPEGKNITLDLNGYVLSAPTTGGSVITNSGSLTIQDTATTNNTHYFVVQASGLWKLDTTKTSGEDYTFDSTNGLKTAAGAATTDIPVAGKVIKVTGGCITGGNASTGGGVYNSGTLTLSGGNIIGNTATNGGGIYIGSGTTKLDGVTVTGNTATENGGGVNVCSAGGCFAEGTKITMGDGSIKNIEDVSVGDYVRSFNHETGEYESNKVIMAYEGETKRHYFTLHFASGTQLSICTCHDLFEQSANRYAAISEDNYSNYIGKYFYNASIGTWDQLLSVTQSEDAKSYYALYAAKTLNCIANGMLSIPDENPSLHIFTYNADLTVNQEALQADIDKYGLYEFSDCKYITSYELYEAFAVKYYYIVFGKGLATPEEAFSAYNELYAEETPGGLTIKSLQSSGPRMLLKGSDDPEDTALLTVGGTTQVTGNKAGTVELSDNNLYLPENTTVTISTTTVPNGMSIGVTLASGTGAFTANGSSSYAQYFTSDNSDYVVAYNTKQYLELVTAVCKIGNNKYVSIADALAAAPAGENKETPTTITMIADTAENVTIASNRFITLDLNGHVLQGAGSGSVITNNGTLTITDSKGGELLHDFTVPNTALITAPWKYDTGDTATPKYKFSDGALQENTGTAAEPNWTAADSIPAADETITVYGGCITGGVGTGTGDDTYGGGIYNSGTLTLSGGTLVGSSAKYGGGVYNTGTFTMNGGAAIGNKAGYYGGGVYSETGTFNFSAGVIGYNYSGSHGGGIYNGNRELQTVSVLNMSGTAQVIDNKANGNGGGIGADNWSELNLLGGTITGNISNNPGGGVHANSYDHNTITLGGTIKITGNTWNKAAGNTRIPQADNLCVVIVDNGGNRRPLPTVSAATPLTTGAEIGISTDRGTPTAGSPVTITGPNSADYSGYFTSDNADYKVYNTGSGNSQILQLSVHEHTWNYGVGTTTKTDDTLKAWCAENFGAETEGNCTYNTEPKAQTVIIQAPVSLTYDGNAKAATLSSTTLGGLTTLPAIKYQTKTDGNSWSDATTTAPTAAGTYKASITVGAGESAKTASVEYTIAKKTVVVSGITAENKTYDGNTTAKLNYSDIAIDGLVGSETLTATATGTFADANAGNGKTVNISNITLANQAGQDYLKNYELAASGNQTNTTANITKKDITVTITPNGGTYGGTITGATAVFNDLVNSESLTPVLTYSGNANDGTGASDTSTPTKAGSFTVTAALPTTGDIAKNYNLTGTTTASFVVAKAPVDAPTIDSKVYTGNTLIADVDCAGKQYSVTSNNGGVTVGQHDVVLTLTDANNYKWSDADTATKTLKFQITQAANNWTSEPKIDNIIYGGTINPVGTAQFGTVVITYVGTGTTSYNSTTAPTDAGTYKATFAVEATNDYGSLSQDVTFTISPKALTVTGTTADGKDYDGTADAVVHLGTVAGIVDGDNGAVTVTASGTFTDKNAENGKDVNITYALSGTDAGNYTKPEDSKTSADISKRALTISTAEIADKTYDGTRSATVTSVTFDGLANSETLTEGTDYTVSGVFDSTDAGGTNAAAQVTVTVTLNETETAKNYTVSDTEIAKTIAKAAITPTPTVTMADYQYGKAVSRPIVTDNTGGGAVTWYYSTDCTNVSKEWTGITPTTLRAGTYYMKAVVSETDNYQSADTPIITFKVMANQYPAPTAPTVENFTVTIAEADREKALEYAVTETGAAAPTAWTAVPALTNGSFDLAGLKASTNYTIYLRQKASPDGNYLSSQAGSTNFTTPDEYSVAYNANRGIGTLPESVTATSDQSVTIGSGSGLTRTGYTFGGWNTQSDGQGTAYAEGDSISNGAVLYAQWNANSYTVQFSANGGTGTMAAQSFTYGTAAKLTENSFSNTGYTFAGWATSASGPVEYTDKQQVQNLAASGTVTLYAVWTQNVYTVTVTVISPYPDNVTLHLTRGSTSVSNEVTVSLQHEGANYIGTHSFELIPAGTYDIVAKQNISGEDRTVTASCVLTNESQSVTVNIPEQKVNSILSVEEDTRQVVVGNLNEEAVTKAEEQKTVTLEMTVAKQEEQALPDNAPEKDQQTQEDIAEIKKQAEENAQQTSGQTSQEEPEVILEYLEIEITKTVKATGGTGTDEETEQLTETDEVIEIIVPYDLTGKEDIRIYRRHNGVTKEFEELDAKPTGSYEDGTFYLDETNDLIYIYANQFSTYAIAYVEQTASEEDHGGTVLPRPKYDEPDEDEEPIEEEVPAEKPVTEPEEQPEEPVTEEPVTEEPETTPDIGTVELPFTDVAESNWFYAAVSSVYGKGLMNGVSDTLFDPNGSTTRGMVATILWRLAGSPAALGNGGFTDVEMDMWYTTAIAWGTGNGLLKGYGDGTFGPNDPITREQLVAILWRLAVASGVDVSVGEDTNILSYNDAFDISEYAIPAFQWACGIGLAEGSNGYLMPTDTATRAQIATLIMRAWELLQ